MPLVYRLDQDNFSLGIWENSNPEEDCFNPSGLTPEEEQLVNSFRHTKRKQEWLTVRRLLSEMGSPGIITYDEAGKPWLKDGPHISISHTRDKVAILLSSTRHAGIDIETIDDRILRIWKKFLSESEMTSLTGDYFRNYLYIIWSAKEVMFKAYGKGGLDFRKHLRVETFAPSDRGTIRGILSKVVPEMHFTIHYRMIANLLLAYSVD